MNSTDPSSPAPRVPVRREPPKFRLATVLRTEQLTPRLVRVTLAGPELQGFRVDEPAASVRLLLPPLDHGDLVIPEWNGNEFLLPDGNRPPIRTFTPRRADPDQGELDLDIVVHDHGRASTWATSAEPGQPAAVSGPGRGYEVDSAASGFLLAGDETAIPAISQLLESIPDHCEVRAHIEVAHPDAELVLPRHPSASVTWHVQQTDAPPGAGMAAAVTAESVPAGVQAWVAGEAAAVQRVRRHLFQEEGLPRSQAAIRGYWKHGREGT